MQTPLASTRANRNRARARGQKRPIIHLLIRALVLLSVFSALSAPIPASADFKVLEASTRLEDDHFMLDARIDYRFSDKALEALSNGVPLTLVVHVRVRPDKARLWTDSLVDQSFRYRIRFKPLSESYLVTQLPGTDGRSYVSRDAAIDALGDIRDLHLLDRGRLEPGIDYQVQIRVSLDVERLPLPLRPTAYLHPAWKQASDWTRWPLRP
ncbi:DUF4390 domain-containing protein [Thiorhodovibrio winogradskyi]|nr:DUF4390 domain-containing protein [Thiorhodovibrio winogradskyi]